jgi:hypothetical protein
LTVTKKTGGVETTPASAPCAFIPGDAYTVNVQIEKNLHRVYVNGTLRLEFQCYEPGLSKGRFGRGTYAAAASFKSISVNHLLTEPVK